MAKTSKTSKTTSPEAPVDPALYTPPVITIAGNTYTLRRLGVRDVFAVAKILGNSLDEIRQRGGVANGAALISILLSALVDSEKQVLELIASLIGVRAVDLADPNQFPLDATFQIIDALSEHEDLKAFLARASEMADRLTAQRAATPPDKR